MTDIQGGIGCTQEGTAYQLKEGGENQGASRKEVYRIQD